MSILVVKTTRYLLQRKKKSLQSNRFNRYLENINTFYNIHLFIDIKVRTMFYDKIMVLKYQNRSMIIKLTSCFL